MPSRKRRIHDIDSDEENTAPSTKRRRIDECFSATSSSSSHSNTNTNVNDIESSSDGEEEEEEEQAKWSCNAIRSKLLKLRQTPGFKITNWCKENGVNSNSYGRFMKLKGLWNGTQNGTFWAATRYFKKQEKLKKKEKQRNKKKPLSERKRDAENKKKAKLKKEKEINSILKKIKTVEDNGYDSDGLIFDDCNDVRRKITAFLKRGIFTQSRFLKEIGNVQSKSYHSFMGMGPLKLSGASNATYWKSYHFFEKLRIAEGQKKTAKRLQNEKEFPQGFPKRHDTGRRWCHVSQRPVLKGDKIVFMKKY